MKVIDSGVALVEGGRYRVVDRLHGHYFDIGQEVVLDDIWHSVVDGTESGGVFFLPDRSDHWALGIDEIEPV